MRTHGTLVRWNDDRGFGFIVPAQGTDEVFVHVSAFPRDGVRPRVHESISFEIEAGKDGRKRAVRVQRPGHQGARQRATHRHAAPRRRSALSGILPLIVLAAIGTYGYSEIRESPPGREPIEPHMDVSEVVIPERPSPDPTFTCDGRVSCGQMGSCAEARYFIAHCPGTKMDGDGDGNPCEDQWCGH